MSREAMALNPHGKAPAGSAKGRDLPGHLLALAERAWRVDGRPGQQAEGVIKRGPSAEGGVLRLEPGQVILTETLPGKYRAPKDGEDASNTLRQS